MTLIRFADAAAVSKPTQVGYEAGITAPNATYLQRVIELGVDAYWVLTGRASPLDAKRVDEVFVTIGAWVTEHNAQLTVRDMAGIFKRLYPLGDSESPEAVDLKDTELKLVG